MRIPYLAAGNGGHGVSALTRKNQLRPRVPATIDTSGGDKVTLESDDEQDFGYLRIEYHPASDGGTAKTPGDSGTVDLTTHQLLPSNAPDLDSGAPPGRQPASKPAKRKRTKRA